MFPWNLLPFDRNTQKKFLEMKPEEIENYVQQMMGKMVQPNMQGMLKPEEWLKGMQQQNSPDPVKPTTGLNTEMFETHDFVFVRVPLKDEALLKQMKLFYTSNQVIIEHIPDLSDKHTLVLPATVKRKGAAANYRDGVLELRLQKIVDLQYAEIDISN
ncbi:Hsp20/alpha crystallin family protein [Mesobacillus boroniphilus]|uniref:Hsp20/alpha crystallin family protein n=1 Tax=Mesobacillus boroniphilus TaxID=308892 RepID=A0A944CLE1_9BACI|nr:Hsp20/alpha crystallin family protein [Mesobacillus boroniphilus]MBS8264526.1 Hsp20/alpha crystallin family protein [Mesobacillus boroniphilus]